MALLVVVFALISVVTQAQNTKGDRPSPNKKESRQTRFKTKSKQGEKAKTKDIAGRRIRNKNSSSANRANSSYPKPRFATKGPRQGRESAGQPIRPIASGSPRGSDGSFSGSNPRKRVTVRSSSANSSKRNIYPQRSIPSASSQYSRRNVYSTKNNPFVNNPSRKPKDTQRANTRTASGQRVKVRSATAQVKRQNSFSRTGGSFRNFRSPVVQGTVSNKTQISRVKNATKSGPSSSRKKITVVPRSASKSFIRNKSLNPYAGFFRVKRKGEQATTKDIAGRPLRARNYRTPAQPILEPEKGPYSNRKRIGDQAYRGPSTSYRSATRTTPKAWVGDIAGRKIRGRNFQTTKRISNGAINPPKLAKAKVGDHPKNNRLRGTGFKSSSGARGKVGQPLMAKAPGRSAGLLAQFQNKLGGRKGQKGGGSVSGKSWNNAGLPLATKQPGRGALGILYAGNIKAQKRVKGGGSVSGKSWNNAGLPLATKQPGRGALGIQYAGNIKAKKSPKGGGSISGRLQNNNGQPIPTRTPRGQSARAARYPGGFKHFQLHPSMSDQGEEYAGALKSKKQVKGGGSISGRLQNNNGKPVPVRIPQNEAAAKAGKYPGSFKHFELHPSMSDQGEEFAGFLKRGKYNKNPNQHASALLKKDQSENASKAGGLQIKLKQPGWTRNKNSHEDALMKKDPGANIFKTDGLQIRVKSPGYVQNKNAHEASILKRKQSKESFLVDNLTVKMKQPGWVKNKNAHEDALLKKDPGSNVFKTDGLQIRVKSPGYVQNKNAHEASLKKRDPSKGVYLTNNIYGKVKAYSYRANPSSSKEALRVREPGKAFAKASNYQGNIKMQKFNFLKHPNYHPDAFFVKTNKNNVKEERDFLTNIRLFWAKLFRKNETQPENVKDKVRKPRYDRKEVGIWYD